MITCLYFTSFYFLRYTSPDFLYIRSWLPCIFFSGGVTVGNIGRQLAMVITVYIITAFPLTIQVPSIGGSSRTNYAFKGMTHKLTGLNRHLPKSWNVSVQPVLPVEWEVSKYFCVFCIKLSSNSLSKTEISMLLLLRISATSALLVLWVNI